MTRKRRTVAQLAQEANLDVDEALITLWDAGYDKVTRPNDTVKNVGYARHSLGIASRRELKSISYWMSIFDLYETEFRDLLRELAVPIEGKTERLPPKAVSRLRAEARKRGINPLTGKAMPLSSLPKSKEKPPV